MSLFSRISNKLRAITQSRGTSSMKRAIWNKEFSSGSWNHIAETQGDFVYAVIARYMGDGALVDLGCGVGSTGIELPAGTYRQYTGVDISDVALMQARSNAEKAGRASANHYVQADIETFLPAEPVDVILLRECLYYIPKGRVPAMLSRLAARLKPRGVVLIRLFDRDAYAEYVQIIKDTLQLVEEVHAPDSKAVTLACRAR
jgi:2-polyprenyl-3-methyl-5-hydroxy-6-metoxy-1,4-benzoquinol methylase